MSISSISNIVEIVGNNPQDINLFFRNWNTYTEADRLSFIRVLRSKGHLSAKYKEIKESDFRCPLHGFNLIKPCGIKTCQYNIELKVAECETDSITQCRNCIIKCIDLAKNNRLSANETSILLGISVSEINVISMGAVAKIKRAKIKESIERFQIPKYKYVEGHCVHCEQFIRDELEMGLWPEFIIEHGKFGWCNITCKDKKPRWQFYIEREFECHFLYALAVGILTYQQLENLSSIFGVGKETINKNKSNIYNAMQDIKKFFS